MVVTKNAVSGEAKSRCESGWRVRSAQVGRSEQVVFALSADMIGSRLVEDRPALRLKIAKSVLPRLVHRHENAWLAPLKFTRGLDEMSAVLRTPVPIMDIVAFLGTELWPVSFRFGVGVGTLDVGLRTGDAARMDGPAFHNAARALSTARDANLPLAFEWAGVPEVDLRLLEATVRAYRSITAGWTRAASKAVLANRQHSTQKVAAEHLGVSPQAMSKALQRADVETIDLLEGAIGAKLKSLY